MIVIIVIMTIMMIITNMRSLLIIIIITIYLFNLVFLCMKNMIMICLPGASSGVQDLLQGRKVALPEVSGLFEARSMEPALGLEAFAALGLWGFRV